MGILIALVIIETILLILFSFVAVRLTQKQKTLVENAELLVRGKLDIEDVPIQSIAKQTNMDIISSGFNSIKTNLLTFIESTKQNVVVLSDAVDKLNYSMKANQSGNEQIASNSTEVDEKTINQLELVKDNLSIVEENSRQMEEAVREMEVITNMLIETSRVSGDGMNNLEGYARDVEEVSVELNDIHETLNRFNSDIKLVSEVGDFIIGISNQLKLLSFNASIEAARAGQAGRGFAVVADEMTGMSEKTKEGMDRISSILSDITLSSESVTKSIQKCSNTYENSKVTFETVNKSFTEINDHAIKIQGKITEINKMFEVIAMNADKSKDMAQMLHETARDISEKTSEIAGVSQEVTAESLQIGENTEALSGMVDSIRKMLKRFNTGIAPTATMPNKTIKIALFSMYDNDFWYGVGRGAVYAAKELAEYGAEVEFIPIAATADMDVDTVSATHMKRLIEAHYDGIIYPGFLGGVEFLLKRAKDEGIKLMAYNCDCENKMLREACLSSNSVSQGAAAAKAAANLTNKAGNYGILMGRTNVIGNVERNRGFRETLKEYKNIKIVDEVMVDDDGDDVYNKTKAWLSKDKNIDILFLTNGYLIDAAKAISDSGMTGKTAVIGYDVNPELIPYIKSGVIGTVINQDSFGQGHDPIVYMYNHIVDGTPYPSEYIESRSSIVNKNNVNDLI